MEDRIIEGSKTPRNTAKQDYADRLFSALVSSLTKDLQRGLENFLVSNHIKRKEIFLKFLEDNGYSLDTARHLAIIERRALRKQRTKTRNEKIKTDRIAAREERRRMKAEREQKEGWATEPIPKGMFIQFYPKPHESVPMSGDVFVFFSKNRQSVNILRWDTDGFLLYQKRLERGSFELPRINPVTGYYELSWETFSFIMTGVSLESVQFRKRSACLTLRHGSTSLTTIFTSWKYAATAAIRAQPYALRSIG